MAGNIPGTRYKTSDFLSKFGNIAQTSQYRAHWAFPSGFNNQIRNKFSKVIRDEGSVLCNATSLPGSSLATHDVANDYYGVTQKSAYRRQFDNTIDLTFYIDANYQMLYLFEAWMEYIMPLQGTNLKSGNSYYRTHYPNHYRSSLYIHKFNKDDKKHYTKTDATEYSKSGDITYEFINAFPQNISSTTVSYNASANLEFTVTFAYDRYITDRTTIRKTGVGSQRSSSQAELSAPKDNPSNPNIPFNLAEGERYAGDNAFELAASGALGDGLGITQEKLINNSFDLGHLSGGTQATTGRNVNDSTKRLQDARDGAGSNTTVSNPPPVLELL
jgi:hypothetical protein